MRHRYRYLALIAHDHPVDNPLMVIRVSRAFPGRVREERYRPSSGWTTSDPLNREWFVNVAITEDQANRLLSGLGDDEPGDDRDPRGTTTRSRPTSTPSRTR
jgi:hypothetical protein